MKKALLYSRVSTQEQSERGHSLAEQERALRRHCERKGTSVLAHFSDDSSGKTFTGREGWGRLMAFVESRAGEVNQILFTKWSRFSRDHAGAMQMIQQLGRRGIECQATEQPIDFDVPEQGLMLAFYVAAPQVENDRRALNTKKGMRQAKREGRWVASAPTGYDSVKAESDGKQRLHADWGEPGDLGAADLVLRAFEMAAERRDLSLEQIRRGLREEGLTICRSRFPKMLRRQVYTGRIRIKAWRGDPEEIVEGLHEAIVPKALYRRVQNVRFGEDRGVQSGPNRSFRPQLFLRGHLVCPDCGEALTGSRSKGRDKYYWYYHHQSTSDCSGRHSAPKAHDALPEYLDEISVADEVVTLYRSVLSDLHQGEKKRLTRKRQTLKEKEERLQERLFKADEALVEGKLQETSHARLMRRYNEKLETVRQKLAAMNTRGAGLADKIDFAASLLSDLGRFYEEMEPRGRHRLIGSIFPSGIVFSEGQYRTTPESPVIRLLRPESTDFEGPRGAQKPERLFGCPRGDAHSKSEGLSVPLSLLSDPTAEEHLNSLYELRGLF